MRVPSGVRRALALLPAIVLAASAALGTATSERYAFSTYREQAGRLTVYADGYPASLSGDAPYVPISVAIAMTANGKAVAFTPESFMLIDAKGQAVPAAGFEEIARRYDKVTFDRSLVRMRPIQVGSYVSDLARIDASFYPPVGGGTRIPRVELGPFSWFRDVVYFPRPQAGLHGVLTLRVDRPGSDPIDVRFEIPAL